MWRACLHPEAATSARLRPFLLASYRASSAAFIRLLLVLPLWIRLSTLMADATRCARLAFAQPNSFAV